MLANIEQKHFCSSGFFCIFLLKMFLKQVKKKSNNKLVENLRLETRQICLLRFFMMWVKMKSEKIVLVLKAQTQGVDSAEVCVDSKQMSARPVRTKLKFSNHVDSAPHTAVSGAERLLRTHDRSTGIVGNGGFDGHFTGNYTTAEHWWKLCWLRTFQSAPPYAGVC